MKRTGHFFDSIVAFSNLWRAAHKAWRGKKDKTRIANFYFNLERELLLLQGELISGTYQPRPYHVFEVTDPKRREIAAADFRDRVVHHAIINVLDPISAIPNVAPCAIANDWRQSTYLPNVAPKSRKTHHGLLFTPHL